MEQKFKCSICGRGFAQDYTKELHERKCKERKLAMKKHPERYPDGRGKGKKWLK